LIGRTKLNAGGVNMAKRKVGRPKKKKATRRKKRR